MTTISTMSPHKRSCSASASAASSSSHSRFHAPQPQRQMRLYSHGNEITSNAAQLTDIAIADLIMSNALSFSLSKDPKFRRVLEVAKNLGPNYKTPDRRAIGGKLLDSLYRSGFEDQLQSLRQEADVFGISIFGDGATIKSVPLVNVLAASPNNPSALLEIVDCTCHMAAGGKKDAPYLSDMILPLIKKIEEREDKKKKHGLVDLVLFDGASNVTKAGRLLAINHPRITALHGAEHVLALFFKDVYTKVSLLLCVTGTFLFYGGCFPHELLFVVSSLQKFI